MIGTRPITQQIRRRNDDDGPKRRRLKTTRSEKVGLKYCAVITNVILYSFSYSIVPNHTTESDGTAKFPTQAS